MSNLGLGVLIKMLGGNAESAAAYSAAMGKTIKSVAMKHDELRFRFEDGTGIALRDEGQSCCESRYMSTDDDLEAFVGATLGSAEVRPGPSVEKDYGECHDTEFLVVETSLGSFTCVTHNEHNGYYGGFSVRARTI